MKSMTLDSGDGSGAGTARASVGISADGQYSITVYPEVSLTTRTTYTTQQMVYGKLCQIENKSTASPPSGGTSPVTINIQGDGKIDPKTPDHFPGSTQEKEGRTTQTLTWDLQRK